MDSYTRRDAGWYRDMGKRIDSVMDDIRKIRHEIACSHSSVRGKPTAPSKDYITERIGQPKLLNGEEYVEHMNNILKIARTLKDDGKCAEEAIPILSGYANDALDGARSLGLDDIAKDFAGYFAGSGLRIE